MKNASWTIEELATEVAQVLKDANLGGQPTKRISEIPDTRAIRYYTTLGIFARPAGMRGRTALYGPRHLLQLVAIKRLQAAGDSLQAIQQKMLTASAKDLLEWAALPPAVLDRLGGKRQLLQAQTASPTEERARFWAAPTAAMAAAGTGEPDRYAAPRSAVLLPLGEGVALQLEGVDLQAITPEALVKLQHAASSLVSLVQQMMLAAPSHRPAREQ